MINLCEKCANENCQSKTEPGEVVLQCGAFKRPPTRADRIRAMNDEELAEFLCGFRSDGTDHFVCMECVAGNYCKMGHNGMIDWLQLPAEEE